MKTKILVAAAALSVFGAFAEEDAFVVKPVKSGWGYWPTLVRERKENLRKTPDSQLLMIGSSNVDFQFERAKRVLDYYVGGMKPVNFAIGGDTPANVLWRIEDAKKELAALKPKAVLMYAGVNAVMKAKPGCEKETAWGAKAMADELQKLYPDAEIFCFKILPARPTAADPVRKYINLSNQMIVELMKDNKKFHFVEMPTDKMFCDEKGNIRKEMMSDFIHPGEAGYALIWEYIYPEMARVLGLPEKKPNPLLKLQMTKPAADGYTWAVKVADAPVRANVARVWLGQKVKKDLVLEASVDGKWTKVAEQDGAAGAPVFELGKVVTASEWRVGAKDGSVLGLADFKLYLVEE